MNHQIRLFQFFSILITLTSCAPLVTIEQPEIDSHTTIASATSLGQSFVSTYRGLSGLTFFISPGPEAQGDLYLTIHRDIYHNNALATAKIPLSKIDAPGFYAFTFPVQKDSFNKYYYAHIKYDGIGEVSFGSAPGVSYLNGAIYLNGQPNDGQLSFRLRYDPWQAFWGLCKEMGIWLVYILAAIFLFLIPGYAVLSLLPNRMGNIDWLVEMVLASGISISIYPLFLLWTDLLGLHLGRLYAIIPPLVGLIVLIHKKRFQRFHKIDLFSPTHIIFLAIIVLVIFSRFWVIRNLEAPMWGDSYHHTLISQLIVNNNGLFSSWDPFAQLSSFTYHFGFHSLVAVFHWVTSLELHQATLWVGQIVNILAVLCVYPIAKKIGKNSWGGIIAVTIVGLISFLPILYTNWGRYTQLSGQVILPVIYIFIWWVFEESNRSIKELVSSSLMIGLLLAGLALTHYRVAIMALMIPLGFFIVYRKDIQIKTITRASLVSLTWMLFLVSPWVIKLFQGKLIPFLTKRLSTPTNQISQNLVQYNNVGDLFIYLSPIMWVLLMIFVSIGFWKRNKGVASISLWWLALLIITNPEWIKLSGTGLISNFALFIFAYIFAGSIIGGVAGCLIYEMNFPNKFVFSAVIFISITMAAVNSMPSNIDKITPQTFAMVTRPDINAFSWIDENLDPDAKLLANSFLTNNQTVAVGCDGGWWLPYFSNRSSSLPPAIYTLETSISPSYQISTTNLTRTIQTLGISHPDTIQMLHDQGITHLYIGQRRGLVGNSGYRMEPAELINHPQFIPVYNQDLVWIFHFVP